MHTQYACKKSSRLQKSLFSFKKTSIHIEHFPACIVSAYKLNAEFANEMVVSLKWLNFNANTSCILRYYVQLAFRDATYLRRILFFYF